MVKLSDPPIAIGSVVGWALTEKSPEGFEERVTYGLPVRSRPASPMLRRVNVLLTGVPIGVDPKSVSSSEDGVVSPLTIVVPLPWTSIHGGTSSTSTLSNGSS